MSGKMKNLPAILSEMPQQNCTKSRRRCGWILCLILTACASKKAPPPAPAYPVQIGTSAVKSMPLFLETLGHVESITSIQIRSRIEGELTGVFFRQGQEVKQGDLLFTIDSKPYEAALKEAQGALEQNLANLALAEEKVKRYKILAKEEYYSQIDYETLQANFASAAALVQQNQGALDNAKINLDYCWIYAPIDGMLGILNIDYGNLVARRWKYRSISSSSIKWPRSTSPFRSPNSSFPRYSRLTGIKSSK